MQQAHVRIAFFLALLLGVLALTATVFLPYIMTIAVAATAAVIFYPLYRFLLGKLKNRRNIATLLTVLATIVIVVAPLTFIALQVAKQAASLYTQITNEPSSLPNDFLALAEDVIQRFLPGVSVNLGEYVGQALQWLVGNVQSVFAGTIRTIVQLFLGIIAYYYMLRDGHKFIDAITILSPLAEEEDRKILDRLKRAVQSVIRGSIIIAILQGIATGIGLTIFGVKSAVLLGSIAGIGALIPTVGTGVVLAPVIIYLFITQNMFSAIGLIIWGALAVGLIDNFLHPILVGKGMRLHPFFVFFAVIGGITAFGLPGFILGPLIVSLLFALLDIFREEMKESRKG